ncbi:hypothetical protein SNOG_08264 [Parastagonospora nodorum SN15]|uniref:Uncharacterized protein n=1 Tax=Phaeosphaeria nodorum (strain SN15 / ATCC MYA-4574 / FGSC 10173) TaxID=321614 RepID=Q0UJ00_PHANO|nr:hypothetical protein SNOG_08264 [Parastagonospora nodorum SN15]EAT84540.1 hypothetical protein SNOG_08264 [Parastagonospora nodorum SN15]
MPAALEVSFMLAALKVGFILAASILCKSTFVADTVQGSFV